MTVHFPTRCRCHASVCVNAYDHFATYPFSLSSSSHSHPSVTELHVILKPRWKYGEWNVDKQGYVGRFSSGLNGPCSDEIGSPKKWPDHTLLLKIIYFFYFNHTTRTTVVHTIMLRPSVWLLHDCSRPLAWLLNTSYHPQLAVILAERSISRSFLDLPQHSTEWECSRSFFSSAGRSNWYSSRAGFHRTVVLSTFLLLILRMARVKLGYKSHLI
jgi:hypothetical protein